jgi:hypothetical protein
VKTMRRAFVTALGLASMAALVPSAHASAQMSKDMTATVTVDNTRPVPVVVYMDHGPFDTRLGTVAPHTRATLHLPSYLAEGETVQVFVHPEGEEDLASQDVTVNRGQNIDIYVPTNDAGYVPPPPPEEIPNPGPGTTTVTVDNERNQPVTVFLEQGAFDNRIGTVAANQQKTLVIPAFLTRDAPDIEIFVHPEGGLDLASQTFDLRADAHLLVKVPPR